MQPGGATSRRWTSSRAASRLGVFIFQQTEMTCRGFSEPWPKKSLRLNVCIARSRGRHERDEPYEMRTLRKSPKGAQTSRWRAESYSVANHALVRTLP